MEQVIGDEKMKMNSKKAALNNVFVYILSIIIVVFCSFLVVKFVSNFSGDAKSATENKVLDTLKEDYKEVYIKYGAENINTYRFSDGVETVCFVQKNCNSSLISEMNKNEQNSLNSIILGDDNVALFDKADILTSTNIGEFNVEEQSGCLCIKPNNNRINLVLTNQKNKVWIKENR